MAVLRITKRAVDALQPNGRELTLWDDTVTGFGVRLRPTGAKSYVVIYRAGAGRGAPMRRYTIASVGKITPERARARAKVILGAVAHGHDPANQKAAERGVPTVAELADRFMADHVKAKRKAGTAEFYRDILDRIVKPAVGTTKADKLTRLQVGRLHSSLADTPRPMPSYIFSIVLFGILAVHYSAFATAELPDFVARSRQIKLSTLAKGGLTMKKPSIILFTIALCSVFAVAPAIPAFAISADLAKKCRDLAIKSHPPAPAGTRPYAQAERDFFNKCVAKNGEMQGDESKQSSPQPKN